MTKNQRIIRQTIIALIFSSVFSLLIFCVYYFYIRSNPSCFDNVLNQGEQEADCGGPCVSCELNKIKDIEVVWSKAVLNRDNFYDLAAQIHNPNQNYGSGEVPYRFILYDTQGVQVSEINGTTYILPDQEKYLLAIKIPSSVSIKRADLVFGEIENWEKPANYRGFQLVVRDKQYQSLEGTGQGAGKAKAMAMNKTIFDFAKVDIDILLFDASHNLLAVGQTDLRDLLAGQERDFVFTWFSQIPGQVSTVEVAAETNIFDKDNFLSTGASKIELFQEY